MPKFPHIKVKLVGKDGNAFAVMGFVTRAMRKAGCTKEDVDEYMNEAMSGDYDNLLRVSAATVNVH